MRELLGLIMDNLQIFLIIAGVGLVVCGIIYALFFKKVNKLIVKYKEIILYIFFGALTTFVNMGVFGALSYVINDDGAVWYINLIAWAVAVVFAFVVNKWFVFGSKTTEKKALGKEFLSFTGARVLSLLPEEIILVVFVTWLGLNEMVFKLIAQVIVLVMNYIFSKFIIFKKK